MFADIVHVQSLFHSNWPAASIGDSGLESGNNGETWNYGQNFGGGDSSLTVHSGGVGMFGTMGVDAPFFYPTTAHPCDSLAPYEKHKVIGHVATAGAGYKGIVDWCKHPEDYASAYPSQAEFINFVHAEAARMSGAHMYYE